MAAAPLAPYQRHGALFHPTAMTRGPWAAETQNGAMVAGLLAYVLDQVPAPVPMVAVELHVQILKPIAFLPTRVDAEVLREGRKMQAVRGRMSVAGTDVALASLLRLREERSPTESAASLDGAGAAPPPDLLEAFRPGTPFFEFIDCRLVKGGFSQPGPGTAWLRARTSLVQDEPPSSLSVIAVCADCGSGLSAHVARREWTYPNVSLSIHAHRPAQGSWLLLDSEMTSSGHGVAQVTSTYADRAGPFGRVQQAVILERAPPSPTRPVA